MLITSDDVTMVPNYDEIPVILTRLKKTGPIISPPEWKTYKNKTVHKHDIKTMKNAHKAKWKYIALIIKKNLYCLQTKKERCKVW